VPVGTRCAAALWAQARLSEELPARLKPLHNLEEMNDRQRWVWKEVRERGRVCGSDIVGQFGVAHETARQDLARMVDFGLLERLGTHSQTWYAWPAMRAPRKMIRMREEDDDERAAYSSGKSEPALRRERVMVICAHAGME